MTDLSLIIPAKNEKDSLPNVLEELKNYNFETLYSVYCKRSDVKTTNQ